MEHLQETYSSQDKVAIIALWPRAAILPSVLRLISILSNENVHPVCIVNKSKHLASWLPKLQETNATIIIRPNVGRDFGAYRAGYHYLKKRRILEQVTNLVFVNDSIYFLDNSKEAIRSTISSTADVSTLFINYQFHLHAQSFFLSFSRSAFNSKKFAKFWDSYYPSAERKHAIEKGEVKLSRILQKSGYLFDGYYSASRIGQTIQQHPLIISEAAVALKALDDPQTLRRREYLPEYFVPYLSAREAESENTSHHFGLFLTRVLGAPIKLDILKTGLATTFDLKTALESHLSPDEVHSLLIYMQSQGTWASNRGLKAIWIKRGLMS